MAKQPKTDAAELEILAAKLDALAADAETLADERVVKMIFRAAKSARWADKQRTVRLKKVGSIILALQSKGLSADEIVAQLTK